MSASVNPARAWHQAQSSPAPDSWPIDVFDPFVMSDPPQNLGIGLWGIFDVSKVFQEPACFEPGGVELVEVASDIGQVGTVHRKA